MIRPLFTPDELAELAVYDADVEASFAITEEEKLRARLTDREARKQELSPSQRNKIEYQAERQARLGKELYQRRKAKGTAYDPVYMRMYRSTHADEIAALKSAWYAANREAILRQKKEQYAENREEILRKKRENYGQVKLKRQNDPDYHRRQREAAKRYRDSHKEKISAYQAQYRARKKAERSLNNVQTADVG